MNGPPTGEGRTERPQAAGADRRTVLRAAGGAGLLGAVVALTGRAAGIAAGAPSTATGAGRPTWALGSRCDLTPESIQGPFYLPDELVRDDIRESRRGVVLRLFFQVVDADTCQPMPRAAVDIWHCDALGEYSGVAKRAEGEETIDSSSFLRGIQLTGDQGRCSFTTIIPGWYPGRAAHIHTKVHLGGDVTDHHYVGGHVAHTGQVFFTEKQMEIVERLRPYSTSPTTRLHNKADSYYQQSGGAAALVDTTPQRRGHPHQGYTGTMTLAVDPNAVP